MGKVGNISLWLYYHGALYDLLITQNIPVIWYVLCMRNQGNTLLWRQKGEMDTNKFIITKHLTTLPIFCGSITMNEGEN